MEAQNNQLQHWKPTRFMLALQENTGWAIAKMAEYTPEQVEGMFSEYNRHVDHLDTLRRQLEFIEGEYEGDDQLELRAHVCQLIQDAELTIAKLSPPRSLSSLSRENRESTSDMLILMVNFLRSYFMVDKMISSAGIENLVPLIIVEFGSLTLEEVAVCFNRARVGYYGTNYNRLDGHTIMQWLRKYSIEKQERQHLEHLNKHIALSSPSRERTADPQDQKMGLEMALSHMEITKARQTKKT